MLETIPLINKRLEAFGNPKIFLTNRGAIMDKIIPYFLKTKLEKAMAAVLFQDVVGNGLKYATEAKKRKIPIVVVQHGKGAVCDYLPPNNHTLLADKICVWGQRDHDLMIRGGISPDKVVLSGCPLFDGESNERKKHKGINVLFAPGHIKESSKNMAVMDALQSIRGINIYAKLLSVHKREQYGKNLIVSNSFDSDHIRKCFDAVKMSDVLITNTSGTIETIALFFDIPVIFVDNLSGDVEHHSTHLRSASRPSGTYYVENVNELPAAVNKMIKEPTLLRAERRKELVETAGVDLPSPVAKIVDTIKGVAR